jgi:hypothetical protein
LLALALARFLILPGVFFPQPVGREQQLPNPREHSSQGSYRSEPDVIGSVRQSHYDPPPHAFASRSIVPYKRCWRQFIVGVPRRRCRRVGAGRGAARHGHVGFT